jgi:hypothetical protein
MARNAWHGYWATDSRLPSAEGPVLSVSERRARAIWGLEVA